MLRRRLSVFSFLFISSGLLVGCSLAAGELPQAIRYSAVEDINAFLPPSSTPFLPVTATDPPIWTLTEPVMATSSPGSTDTLMPTSTATEVFTLTWTDLPSVTPTGLLPVFPSSTPRPTIFHPTYTNTWKVVQAWTATFTQILQNVVAATAIQTPTATETGTDTETPTETNTLTGSETATMTFTDTLTSTITLTPSLTWTPSITLTPTIRLTNTPAPTTTGCATFNFDWEAQVAVLLNQERAKAGLPAWQLNSILTRTARAHSVDMVVNKFMSHTGSDGSTPQERIKAAGYKGNWWGEIIAGGTPQVAVTWWMNEPGHRAQIINTHYTDFGVGYAYCPGQGWFTVDQGGP